MKYTQATDAWIRPRDPRKHYIRCCDCGLAHRIEFRVKAGRVEFRAFRLRRRKQGELYT